MMAGEGDNSATLATTEAPEQTGGQAPPEATDSEPGGGFTEELANQEAAPPAGGREEAEPTTDQPQEPTHDPEEDAEPEAEPEDDAKPKEWDKDRQARDQKMANLLKENEALKAQLETAKAASANPDAGALDEDGDEADLTLDGKSEAQLRADIKPLDEFSSEEDRNHNLTILAKLDELRSARDQAVRDRAAYYRILRECDKDYGAEFRNEAMARAKKLAEDQGFGTKIPLPSPAHTRLALRGIYAELKADKLSQAKAVPAKTSTPAKASPPAKSDAPVVDPGKGGVFGYDESDVPPPSDIETIDSIFDGMQKSGLVPWARRRK